MHYKKLSEEVLDDNGWWKYKKETFEKPTGGTGEYYYAEANGAAMIVAVREDGRIALVREYRHLMGRHCIAFPCGRIEPQEEPVDAAKRELYEETGCIGDELVNIGMFEPSKGFVKNEIQVYVAYIIEQKPLPDTQEVSEVMFRRPDEITDMIRNNEIQCGQTLAAWALAQNYFASRHSEAVEEVPPGFRTLFNYFLGEE